MSGLHDGKHEYSDGKHESRLYCIFTNAAAMRAVTRFEVSQEQLVPKHKLLVVGIDLEMFTATQMVLVRQVKLQALDQNMLEKDFEDNWDGKRQHYVERCDVLLMRRDKDAFMKQQSEHIDEKMTAATGREPRFVLESVPKVDARNRGRSRCADQEEEEIDKPNQIHE